MKMIPKKGNKAVFTKVCHFIVTKTGTITWTS